MLDSCFKDSACRPAACLWPLYEANGIYLDRLAIQITKGLFHHFSLSYCPVLISEHVVHLANFYTNPTHIFHQEFPLISQAQGNLKFCHISALAIISISLWRDMRRHILDARVGAWPGHSGFLS